MKNWNFMRILRLVVGVFIIVQGVQTSQWMFIVLGILFSIMPLLNIGCCSNNNCNAKTKKSQQPTNDINYEEVL